MKRLVVHDGSLEALKWIALVLMTGDHVNKYLFNGTIPALFNAGRVALPLFIFVLAYNLARPGTLERGAYPRTMKRLALFGVLATPAFIALEIVRCVSCFSLSPCSRPSPLRKARWLKSIKVLCGSRGDPDTFISITMAR